MPPPNSPTASVATIANHSGMPASRQSPPITTAAKPIIEPTERSMPPVIMIGVITNASKTNLDTQPRDLEKVTGSEEVVPCNAEHDTFQLPAQSSKYPLIIREQPFAPRLIDLKRCACR